MCSRTAGCTCVPCRYICSGTTAHPGTSLTRLVPIHLTIRLHLVRWSRRDFLNSGNPLRVQCPVFHYSDHRCLPAGMGWPLPGQCGLWRLAPCGHTLPHQCAGVLSCPSVTPFLSTPAPPAHSSHSYRQCDCSGVHKQAGGHALHQTECPSGSSVEVVQTGGNFSHSVLHPGPGQSHSRLPIPGSSSALGVDPPPDGHGPDNTDSRTTASGPIRVGTQCPPPQVLLQGSRPSSLEDRRVLLPVEGVPGLCLPADLPHSDHTTEDSGGSSAGGADSTLVAEEELVPRTGRPTSRSPEDPAPALRPNSTADISDAAPSAERVAPDCVALIRRAGTQAGLSDRAAALIASSRRVSTCETYNSRLAGYFHWCESHGVEPRSAPAHHIADFLITLFDKGRLISTIKGHRSAIAAIHSGFADGTGLRVHGPVPERLIACSIPKATSCPQVTPLVEPAGGFGGAH